VLLTLVACTTSVSPVLPKPTAADPTAVPTSAPSLTLPTPATTPGQFLKVGTLQRDVPFCPAGNQTLLMDVYRPNEQAAAAPVVISLHEAYEARSGIRFEWAQELLQRGYVVVSIDYRDPSAEGSLTGWLTDGVADARCAVRHLRANAAAYQIDPAHMGAMGCSLGGYLATVLGTGDDISLASDSAYAEQSGRIQAVVAMDGFADLKTNFPTVEDLQSFYGPDATFDDPLIVQANPVQSISKDDPPFLVLVSQGDNRVKPGERSPMGMLYDTLIAQRVSAQFVEIENITHCDINRLAKPSSKDVARLIADFFDQHLK
jgi:pectinesterase